MKKPVFLDNQSTTPMDGRVLDEMLPYFTEKFGNPHSRSHSYGWEAEAAVEKARIEIADLIGANPKEIIFTSGATESNNMAIKSTAHFYKDKKNHIITLVTEHKCVLDACRHLEMEGFEVTYLPVNSEGLVNLTELENAIKPETLMISVMTINNEIGAIQPIKEIGAICRKHDIFFHTDAAQAFGKIALDVNDMNIDLMSISAHKIYGPKGIGALFVRRKPRVRLEPLINGGGQERGMRSGTISPALAAGFGKAASLAKAEMKSDQERISRLSEKFHEALKSAIPDIFLNGPEKSGFGANMRWPGNVNLSFSYIEGESLIMAIKELAVSSGSACTSSSLEPSYVLRALGVAEELAHTSIRFGIGRFTTEEEIDFAIDVIKSKVKYLRDMSPLWEMVNEGIDLKSINWAHH